MYFHPYLSFEKNNINSSKGQDQDLQAQQDIKNWNTSILVQGIMHLYLYIHLENLYVSIYRDVYQGDGLNPFLFRNGTILLKSLMFKKTHFYLL